ncbi:MAG: hypothetical protein AAGC65_06330, partial [Mucilaginibacter sp.]|uniref:hypothetical protein n=1 Tax=Mucilaginibacter sp. TaxID=1882438 RepID=UPI0031B03CBB
MRNIFLTALLAACIFAGCTKSTDTNANHPDSNSSTPNQNTNANQNNSVRLDKFVPILQGQTGDTIYLTYNTDGLLDKAKNTKFTKNYIYSGGKLVRTESKSTLNGVEIKADENLIYNGNNLVKKELLGNTPESSYKLLSYDSILYDGNHIKTIYQITPRPRMNANGTMVTENEITGHTTLKWKNDNVDSLYTYDNNPSPRLAWV